MLYRSNLVHDQVVGLERCVAAARHDRWFRLEGAAGTGKTTIVPYIVDEIAPKKAVGTSTSHVATKRLKDKSGMDCRTVASLFYKHHLLPTPASERARVAFEKRVESGELVMGTTEYDRALKIDVERWMKDEFDLDEQAQVTKLGRRDLLIIDEHSMIKPELLPFLIDHTECMIGLLGDSFQLPPPGYKDGAFKGIPISHELTKIVRADGTNIPEVAGRFRRNEARFENGDFGSFMVRTYPAVDKCFRLSPELWRQLATRADAIIGSHHRTRMHATQEIRHALFGCGIERPLMPGDRFLIKRRNKLGLEVSVMMSIGKELQFPPDDAEPAPEGYLRLDIVDPTMIRDIMIRRGDEMPTAWDAPLEPIPLIFPFSMLAWSYRGQGGPQIGRAHV